MDIIRFVDGIGASPTVRLDINDGATWGVRYDGTDFSPPPLKATWANTMLTDGERLTAAAYANRRITLALDLMASTQDAIATELQKLWQELNRPFNFLMWQPTGVTKPVFFRTIRSSNTRVTDYPAGAMRTVEVQIDAEPFAYGLKEVGAAATVNNDPAAATNGMYFDVTSPKGDVETPLYLVLPGSSVVEPSASGTMTSAIAVRRRGTPSNVPFVLQAEDMTLKSMTTAKRDPNMSGWQADMNANPTFETNIANWTATGGTAVRDTTVFFSGVASLKLTPDGTSASSTVESEKMAVVAGRQYAPTARIRNSVARNVTVGINWFTSGGALISTTSAVTAVAANTWTLGSVSGPAPATATQASMIVTMTGTPPASNVLNVDEAAFGKASHVLVDMAGLVGNQVVIEAALHPTTAGVDVRGTYRVFMRYSYAASGTTATNKGGLYWGRDSSSAQTVDGQQWQNLPHPNTDIVVADMGLVQMPGGPDPVYDGISGVETPAKGIYLKFTLYDPSATYTDVNVDYFIFVPADDRLALIRWQNSPTAPAEIVFDGRTGETYARDATGQIETMIGNRVAGGPPMVTPGITNRVYFALDVGSEATGGTPLTATTTINSYYWPRYLSVRTP